jgi:hypothetical protein
MCPGKAVKIDPTVLTKLVVAGRQVPVVICNLLPVDVKLFRCSVIRTACFAEVDGSQAAEMRPCHLCDPSPDAHPVDALKSSLELLTTSQRRVAEEMLLRRHKAISRGDNDFGLTNWVVQRRSGCSMLGVNGIYFSEFTITLKIYFHSICIK